MSYTLTCYGSNPYIETVHVINNQSETIGTVPYGSTQTFTLSGWCMLQAYPADGAKFTYWHYRIDGELQDDWPYRSITISDTGQETVQIHAEGSEDRYTLTLTAEPDIGGSVTGEGSYIKGSYAEVGAWPADGCTFNSWSDGGDQIHTVQMNSDCSLTAYFNVPTYTLTYYHYLDSTLKETSTETVYRNIEITLADKKSSTLIEEGYTYQKATDASGTEITSATVKSAASYYLYYSQPTGSRTLTLWRGNNARRVDIIYNGVIVATSDDESKAATYSIPVLTSVTVRYTPYFSTSGWYKFIGWKDTNSTTEGTVYSTQYEYTFKMPGKNLTMYARADRQSGNFAWTYAKVQYGEWNLTAQEWHELWDCIQSRTQEEYDTGKGKFIAHTHVAQGDRFTKEVAVEAVEACDQDASWIEKGGTVTAEFMNNLVTWANEIRYASKT